MPYLESKCLSRGRTLSCMPYVPRTRRRREHGHAVARARAPCHGAPLHRRRLVSRLRRLSAVYASRVYSLAVPPAHAGRVPRRSIGLSLAAAAGAGYLTSPPGGYSNRPLAGSTILSSVSPFAVHDVRQAHSFDTQPATQYCARLAPSTPHPRKHFTLSLTGMRQPIPLVRRARWTGFHATLSGE